MCTFHTMLDRVARGHKVFVLQSDCSDTHILIPANESQPLKAAKRSELLGKNSSIKRGLNLYRPSMKCCLSQLSCLRPVLRNWRLHAPSDVPLYCHIFYTFRPFNEHKREFRRLFVWSFFFRTLSWMSCLAISFTFESSALEADALCLSLRDLFVVIWFVHPCIFVPACIQVFVIIWSYNYI